ncbi:Bestrophin, RFP-TM, chloride channel-domain-containing protein [Calycina marina]|uniref:Bestrophin, RFP-TM, chloride channel-domain-containing protein n=1 Tax=Calycina marina TaxID=1763456 RepID=A0A9P8CGB9_9HELO|nr:Bestrophin, RFP-TM, chloride channel-domain-containing protein [Calycina marina]
MALLDLFARRVSILPTANSWTENPREHRRQRTYPLANSSRKKDRRWPLVLRFWKGSIHGTILFPVFIHTMIASFVVYINQHINSDVNLPSSIIPSLSIVVGLMLVFRNQTAFARFWEGRQYISKVTTAVRILSRQILVLTPAPAMFTGPASFMASDFLATPGTRTPKHSTMSLPNIIEGNISESALSRPDELRTIETVKILMAMLYTIKNHLRAEWGVALSPGTSLTEDGQEATTEEYKDLLPQNLKGYEHRGLGLTLELSTFVEDFIRLGVQRKWIHNAASSSMLSNLNDIISSYGGMEVIRLVPIPVAHLIHHRQTLALFCGILPFAMASEMDWWAVPLVSFVAFTLYGIEGIAQTYEDPFGVAKIDINMDDIVEDARREVEVMLAAWQTQGTRGGIFRPAAHDGLNSSASSIFESFTDVKPAAGNGKDKDEPEHAALRVTVDNLGKEIERDTAARRRLVIGGGLGGVSVPSNLRMSSSGYYGGDEGEGSALLARRNDSLSVSPGNVLGHPTDYLSVSGTSTSAGKTGMRLSWADGGEGKSTA